MVPELVPTHCGSFAPRTSRITAGRPPGTGRIGNDPATSVIDRYYRSHTVSNRLPCDRSGRDSSGRGPAIMTIIALAFRAAGHFTAAAKANDI